MRSMSISRLGLMADLMTPVSMRKRVSFGLKNFSEVPESDLVVEIAVEQAGRRAPPGGA